MHASLAVAALSAVGVSAIAAPAITNGPFHPLMPRQELPLDPLDDKENECLTQSLDSILSARPTPTNPELNSWVAETYAAAITELAYVTAMDQVKGACSSALDPDVTPPASLEVEYSTMLEELESWKNDFHDEAYSIAEGCGMIGPFIVAAVATDAAECVDAYEVLVKELGDHNPSSAAKQAGALAAAAFVAGFAGCLALF